MKCWCPWCPHQRLRWFIVLSKITTDSLYAHLMKYRMLINFSFRLSLKLCSDIPLCWIPYTYVVAIFITVNLILLGNDWIHIWQLIKSPISGKKSHWTKIKIETRSPCTPSFKLSTTTSSHNVFHSLLLLHRFPTLFRLSAFCAIPYLLSLADIPLPSHSQSTISAPSIHIFLHSQFRFLTHWGLDKMNAISQTTCLNSDWNFTKVCS